MTTSNPERIVDFTPAKAIRANGINGASWPFTLTMLTAALMSYVPDDLSPLTVAFVAAWSLFLLWNGGTAVLRGRLRADGAAIALITFLSICLLSYFVATLNGVTVQQWLRGALPFFFLTAYFLLPSSSARTAQILLNTVHLACLVWMLKVLVISLLSVEQVLSGEISRLTHLSLDLTLPYGLVGFVITLFNPDMRWAKWRWALLPCFSGVIVASGYRSQIMLGLFIFGLYCFTLPARRRIAAFGGLVVSGMVAFAAVRDTGLGDDLLTRIALVGREIESGSGRMMEIAYALQHFAGSPLLGRGLGFQVPVDVTFAGNWEFIVKAVPFESVGYIHNVWAYMAMDLGLAGILSYAVFLLWPAHAAGLWRTSGLAELSVRRAAGIAVLALAAYFSVQATFRLIQANLLLATLMAVAVTRNVPPRAEQCSEA